MSGPARLLTGIAAWTGVGVLFGVVWTWTVGGTPPVWGAILVGVAVWTTVTFGPGLLAFWRTQPPQSAVEHPNPDRIAVLEHDLLGIRPEPGTRQACAVALAKPADPAKCPHDHIIDVTRIQHTRPIGMCERCGADMVQNDDGTWEQP